MQLHAAKQPRRARVSNEPCCKFRSVPLPPYSQYLGALNIKVVSRKIGFFVPCFILVHSVIPLAVNASDLKCDVLLRSPLAPRFADTLIAVR